VDSDVDFFNLIFGSAVYTKPARLRADDLLVRGRAQEPVAATVALLRDIVVQYQREFVPPASAEHPFPDAALVTPMRRADRAHAAANECLDAIRNMIAPGSDHVWNRCRQPTSLLALLVATDRQLIYQGDQVAAALRGLTVDTLAGFDWTPFEAALAELRQAVDGRRKLTRLNV
jgi:hypothetical protein